MRNLRKTGITALTAAIALTITAVPAALTVPSILASGEGATTVTPGPVSAGYVELTTTSSTGTITYQTQVQTFTGGQQCQIVPTAGGPNLLEIRGSVNASQSGVAGFRDGNIGVFETTAVDPNNAAQCSRVDFGSFGKEEALTLTLPAATYPDAPFGDQLRAASATVDARVANSRDGKITIELLSDDAPAKRTTVTWTNKKAGTPITIPTTALEADGNYTAIRLVASAGSFNLRGARLDLVSEADELFCNPGNPAGGISQTTDAGTTTVNYLGNADESNSCFGVKLTGGDRQYQWLKPLTVSQDAQFVFDQTWTVPAPTVPDYELNKAYINFELKLPQPDGTLTDSVDHELLFCPTWLYPGGDPANELALITDEDTVLVDGEPVLVLDLLEAEDLEPDVAGVDGSQGTQFSCIDKKSRSTKIEVTADGDVLKVIDKIYLIGDAKYRF